MSKTIQLFALDFGSTTSSAIVAKAQLISSSLSGKLTRGPYETVFKSEPIFTPFKGQTIDKTKLFLSIQKWLGHLDPNQKRLTFGGAIMTGLAAKKENADELMKEIRARFPNTLIAIANNSHYESWITFMGNCLELSQQHPEEYFLNFDIGGGTTNVALGKNGKMLDSSSLWIGARHLQFQKGTYQITELSLYGKKTLDFLKIKKSNTQALNLKERNLILNYYVTALEKIVYRLTQQSYDKTTHRVLIDYDFATKKMPLVSLVITLSGGVGELIYQNILGNSWPLTTYYGDFGVDLAQKINKSLVLSKNLKTHMPKNMGRATLYGLALHSTEISGSSIYISKNLVLPLNDIPILGEIFQEQSTNEIENLFRTSNLHLTNHGSAWVIKATLDNLKTIQTFAQKIQKVLIKMKFPNSMPLVFFVFKNKGKTFGNYLTNWNNLPWQIIVIDEIDLATKKAQFANIGALDDGFLPVSFYSCS